MSRSWQSRVVLTAVVFVLCATVSFARTSSAALPSSGVHQASVADPIGPFPPHVAVADPIGPFPPNVAVADPIGPFPPHVAAADPIGPFPPHVAVADPIGPFPPHRG
jgi:hypothetical protein